MPNPGVIFLKAVMLFAVTAVLFQYAQQVGTVEVTVLAGGRMTRMAVQAHDPNDRDELDSARKKARPFYAGAILLGLIGLSLVHKSLRVGRKQREARRPHVPSQPY